VLRRLSGGLAARQRFLPPLRRFFGVLCAPFKRASFAVVVSTVHEEAVAAAVVVVVVVN